jgi:predicted RND superfamily exporter protein
MITTLCDKLGTLCVTWPRQVLAFFGVLTLTALPLVVHLPLEADVRDTLPADMAQALERHNTLFGTADLAFLLVQTAQERKEDLIAFGTALQQKLTAAPLIRAVAFGYSPALLAALDRLTLDYAPLFVSPARLDDFDHLFTPDGLRAQIRKTLLDLSLPGADLHERLLLEDPLQLRRFAFARLAALRGTFRFDATSPYFVSQDGTALLIKVEGWASVHDPAGVKATVSVLQHAIEDLLALPPWQGLTVHATGGYFFAAESERIIRGDMIWNLQLSVVLISLLLTWAFRRWGVLLYGQIPTLLGLFLALGVFALVRPKLNALTLGCAASLVGLGVDYTIHILTHCFAALSTGTPQRCALRTAVRETGGGLMGAALTTIAGFGAFTLAGQHFLQDMGVLAALGIMWCCALCVTFLPALLMCLPASQRHPPPTGAGHSTPAHADPSGFDPGPGPFARTLPGRHGSAGVLAPTL